MHPDLVLYNGVVRTLDSRQPQASAVAIWGDRIAVVGDDSLKETLGSLGKAVNLHGRLVLPGFVDGHVHFMEYALRRQRVRLGDTRTMAEARERVREATLRVPAGEWILGAGWDSNLWPDAANMNRHALDGISREHPIVLDSKDVHTLWVNSLALERAGITDATPDPPGGRICRCPECGEVNGLLNEMSAKKIMWDAVGAPTLDKLCAAVRDAMPTFWAAGVTGFHDCEGAEALAVFQELRRRGELGLRVLIHLEVGNLDAAIKTGIRSSLGDEWLRIGGVKIFMDGSLGSRTAVMFEPYLGEKDYYGVQVISRHELADLLDRAFPNGIAATIHAIGDAANRMVLDELEAALLRHPDARNLRHRIEHVQLLSPMDIPRLAKLDVAASVQPQHATADYEMVEHYWGEPRGQGAYPFRGLLDAGTRLVFGSDCPVEVCDPLEALYAAVTRRRRDGSPGPDGWHPRERIGIMESLHATISSPAYVGNEEALKGSIAPGKVADLVVLSRDIVQEPAEALLETEVLGTMVAGKWVYQASDAGYLT